MAGQCLADRFRWTCAGKAFRRKDKIARGEFQEGVGSAGEKLTLRGEPSLKPTWFLVSARHDSHSPTSIQQIQFNGETGRPSVPEE